MPSRRTVSSVIARSVRADVDGVVHQAAGCRDALGRRGDQALLDLVGAEHAAVRIGRACARPGAGSRRTGRRRRPAWPASPRAAVAGAGRATRRAGRRSRTRRSPASAGPRPARARRGCRRAGTRARPGRARGTCAGPGRARPDARARRGRGGSRTGRGHRAPGRRRSRVRRCSGPRCGRRACRWPSCSSFSCALSTMSPVTNTACGCSRSSARTAASSVCVENASCGRKVELNSPPMRSRNGTRAGDSSSRTCVSVSWPHVAIAAPGVPRAAAVDERLARPGLEEPVAVLVHQRGVERRAGHRVRAAEPPPHAGRTKAAATMSASTPHSSRSPATIGSRRTRRATTAVAATDEQQQAGGDEQDLAGRRRERERGEAGGQAGDERAEGERLQQDAGDRGRDRRRRRPRPPARGRR